MQDGARAGRLVDAPVGEQFAGGGDPGRRPVVRRYRVDASGELVEGRRGLGDEDRPTDPVGDVSEEGIDQSPLDSVPAGGADLRKDLIRIVEGAGAEGEPFRF